MYNKLNVKKFLIKANNTRNNENGGLNFVLLTKKKMIIFNKQKHGPESPLLSFQESSRAVDIRILLTFPTELDLPKNILQTLEAKK